MNKHEKLAIIFLIISGFIYYGGLYLFPELIQITAPSGLPVLLILLAGTSIYGIYHVILAIRIANKEKKLKNKERRKN